MIRQLSLIALTALLAACGAKTETPGVRAHIPVLQPCVDGQRPNAPLPLNQQIPEGEWTALDVKQKAARIGLHAGELRTWGEQLNAATGACR